MSGFADTDDLGLFAADETFAPLAFVGECHLCGARTEPVPHVDLKTGERLDPGERWDGISWVAIALSQHRAVCPGPPPPEPGIHLRPAYPNYTPPGR